MRDGIFVEKLMDKTIFKQILLGYRTGKLLLLNLKFTEYGIFKPGINGCGTLKFFPLPNGASMLCTAKDTYVDRSCDLIFMTRSPSTVANCVKCRTAVVH